MKRIVNWFDQRFEEIILCVLLAAIALVMMTDIIMRITIQSSISWSVEFCQYCFVYTAFISIPYCIKKGTSLNIDIVVNFLPAKIKKVVALLAELISLVLWIFFCYYAWFVLTESVTHLQRSPTMDFPMYWINGMPFVVFAFAVLREFQHIILMLLRYNRRPEGLAPESEKEIV